MKSQVLLTVWCHISGEATGEIWHWSLSGVKGLTNQIDVKYVFPRCRFAQCHWHGPCLVPQQPFNLAGWPLLNFMTRDSYFHPNDLLAEDQRTQRDVKTWRACLGMAWARVLVNRDVATFDVHDGKVQFQRPKGQQWYFLLNIAWDILHRLRLRSRHTFWTLSRHPPTVGPTVYWWSIRRHRRPLALLDCSLESQRFRQLKQQPQFRAGLDTCPGANWKLRSTLLPLLQQLVCCPAFTRWNDGKPQRVGAP